MFDGYFINHPRGVAIQFQPSMNNYINAIPDAASSMAFFETVDPEVADIFNRMRKPGCNEHILVKILIFFSNNVFDWINRILNLFLQTTTFQNLLKTQSSLLTIRKVRGFKFVTRGRILF